MFSLRTVRLNTFVRDRREREDNTRFFFRPTLVHRFSQALGGLVHITRRFSNKYAKEKCVIVLCCAAPRCAVCCAVVYEV